MDILWRGSWTTRARIVSGLVLFTYALFHFLNIGLGLFSPDWMEQAQGWRKTVTRSLPGTVLLYTALFTHAGLALYSLATRRSLKLPFWLLLQMVLGLSIPVFLIVHVVHTRMAHALFGIDDRMSYLIALIWDSPSAINQTVLMLIVWTHGCIGLNYWLRLKPWWPRALPWLSGLALLVPAFALAGFMTEGRRTHALMADPQDRAALMAGFDWPDNADFAALARLSERTMAVFWALLALAIAVHVARRLIAWRRGTVRVRYVDGPEVASPPGMTLLEISRANGIPHMSLCGGRGRCTTCRVVIEDGAEHLPPPAEAERRSLAAVGAPEGTRLACQLRPEGASTVYRVFRPEGGRRRAHARQGSERRLAVLFLDMRGFTGRTAGQLPYDVLFLLNRFFDAIVPPIVATGGSIDKYLGDGLLAVFETADERTSARAALAAAVRIGRALDEFNDRLTAEGGAPVRIGIGLHLGNLVLGEIGAAGNAPRTIIGDTVNVASRLEAMTKEMQTEALVSAAVLTAAGVDLAGLDLCRLDLRGVTDPVTALPAPLAMLDRLPEAAADAGADPDPAQAR